MIAAIKKPQYKNLIPYFFIAAFSIAAAAVAGLSGCRSGAETGAAVVVLGRNRSAFIRPDLQTIIAQRTIRIFECTLT